MLRTEQSEKHEANKQIVTGAASSFMKFDKILTNTVAFLGDIPYTDSNNTF
jgi:hypothetical protein